MSDSPKISFRELQPQLPTLVILAAAVPLGFFCGGIYSIAALALAALCYANASSISLHRAGLEEERRRLDDQLCSSQKFSTVDELSAGIAHEINNPLGIIAQETEWILHVLTSENVNHLREADDCKDSLREIVRQVDRCKEIVHKLLSLAREMEPVNQCVELNNLIHGVADLVDRDAAPRNIRIIRSLKNDIPMVYTDPPLLRQVVLNLLVNATHAIESDGIITVTTATVEDSVEIRIRDTGCGISKENLNRIFTPFFSTKPQGKGTGLGLAICRGIIERMGGYISVTSDVGKSTTFTVHLPIDRSRQGAN